MNETCDRCPARAAYFVTRGMHRLFFCVTCSVVHFAAFATKGWLFWPVSVHAIAPQAMPSASYREAWPDRDPWTPQDS